MMMMMMTITITIISPGKQAKQIVVKIIKTKVVITCDDKTRSCYSTFDPWTLTVKSWVIQSFLTFYSMVRTLKCDHSYGAVSFFNFSR